MPSAPTSLRLLASLALAALALAVGTASGATSSTAVGATVLSATNLDASACATGTAATSFGAIMAGASTTTSADCIVTWGSSNDTAALRMRQADRYGDAMFRQSAGQPDPGFGPGGIRSIDASGAGLTDALVGSVALPGGDVIAAGYTSTATTEDIVLTRWRPDGTLEPTFGTSGIRRIDLGSNERINAIALDGNGRLVGAGEYNGDILLARFSTTTGALDTTFNGTGWNSFVNGGYQTCGSIVVHPDQRISCGGHSAYAAEAVVRVLPTGQFDGSLNGTGYWQSASIGSTGPLQLDAAGRYLTTAARGNDIVVQRRLLDATLDPTFGAGGEATFDSGLQDNVYGMTLDASGRLVIAGATSPGRDMLAVRFTPGGVVDTSFGGGDGFWTADLGGDDALMTALVQRDGSLVFAGYNGNFTLTRLTANGSADASFGTTGASPRYTNFVVAGGEGVNTMVEGADGRLVLVGSTTSGDSQVAVAGTSTIAQYAGGSADWTSGPNAFGACLKTVTGSGVTPSWTPNASCSVGNGAWWNAVPTDTSVGAAKIAGSPTAATSNATAALRFGLRTSANQPPGAYWAPLEFEVVAPNA